MVCFREKHLGEGYTDQQDRGGLDLPDFAGPLYGIAQLPYGLHYRVVSEW